MNKQYSCFVLLFLAYSLLVIQVSAQYTWKQKADFGGVQRCGSFGFSIGNYGYIGGGNTAIPSNLSDFWQYDPASNTWTQKSNIPQALRNSSSFVINNLGYVIGGAGSGFPFNTSLYMYDPVTNTWTTKATYPGFGMYGGAGFAIGNKGYYGIGNAGSSTGPYYPDFYEYDALLDTWTRKATFPGIPRYGVYSIALNGKGYVGFGADINSGTYFNDWWQYDPTTNSWTTKANYPGLGRAYPTGFVINGLIYVGIGTTQSNSLSDFYEYNSGNNVWTQKANYTPGDRWLAAGFSIGNIGYFGTGATTGNYSGFTEFWEYSPNIAIANFTVYFDSCSGNVIITDLSINAATYLYKFGDGDSSNASNPSHLYNNEGEHIITLTINKGASLENSITKNVVTTQKDLNKLFIPNCFTPNDDGKNDKFLIETDCDTYDLKIYNRWGNLLYETSTVPLIWDGTHRGNTVPDGIYVYILKGENLSRHGTVTVIR